MKSLPFVSGFTGTALRVDRSDALQFGLCGCAPANRLDHQLQPSTNHGCCGKYTVRRRLGTDARGRSAAVARERRPLLGIWMRPPSIGRGFGGGDNACTFGGEVSDLKKYRMCYRIPLQLYFYRQTRIIQVQDGLQMTVAISLIVTTYICRYVEMPQAHDTRRSRRSCRIGRPSRPFLHCYTGEVLKSQ
jgi:hypothetical protein